MNKNIYNSINLGVVGYGHFGSRFLKWLKHINDINVLYVVEPEYNKVSNLSNTLLYRSIEEIDLNLLGKTDVILDCSTKGIGEINVIKYKELGIPAVIQSGEKLYAAELYYPGLREPESIYLRIPCCSAISTLRIIEALANAGMQNPMEIYGYHNKTTSDKQMISIDYISGREVEILTGVKSKMNRIYLPGHPANNEYIYAGNLSLTMSENINHNKVVAGLTTHSELQLLDYSVNISDHYGNPNTLIIKESIEVTDNIIRLGFLAMPPYMDYPSNISAIRYLAEKQKVSADKHQRYHQKVI